MAEEINYTAFQTILNWFKTGRKPTQQQFWSSWASFWHKSEQIPITKIDGVQNIYDSLNQCALDNDVVHKNGNKNELITGIKTFEELLQIKSDIAFVGDGNFNAGITHIPGVFSFNDVNSAPTFQMSINGFNVFKDGLYVCQFQHSLINTSQIYQLPNKSGVLAIEKPYKVYRAIISQTGVDNPLIIAELQNDFGQNAFSLVRSGVGRYFLSSNNLFTQNKTTVSLDLRTLNYHAYCNISTTNQTAISTKSANDLQFYDGYITKATLEIRVYN